MMKTVIIFDEWERLSDEESEQKFVALALGFSIDATTIKDRCLRQKRYRDQTEKNLTTEIDRLINKVYRLQPLCIDAETTDMLTDLLSQADIVMRAAAFAAVSAERYGAVQHEDRLTQAVDVMIKHVTLLKQQRDSARKHLQYTKRMLQNTNNLNEVQTLPKAKTMHSRRASIASINQQPPSPKLNSESKRIARRTSELSIRASALTRSSRPSRLELGVDLVKIKEGLTEETTIPQQDDNTINERETEIESAQELAQPETEETNCLEIDVSTLSLREKISYKIGRVRDKTTGIYRNWCDNGKIHEIFFMATLLCFSLSVITLGNILVELEYARNGVSDDNGWSFNHLWSNFFQHIGDSYEKKGTIV
ncbi:lymphoid-restricted membrane protein jaw1 [Holotrichia oblita]|uniref:Lymphoid-restricted membrane protein jaw1 n=1 Tax=Holotrichia oblita TaxID=644536 RepID=A0ACB9T856_HOLOL|nr:lymphoid-restricted membrane protein jaw1 [Holotrichia oblita]